MGYRIGRVDKESINETLLSIGRSYDSLRNDIASYIAYLAADLDILVNQYNYIIESTAELLYYDRMIDAIPETRQEMYERVKELEDAYLELEALFPDVRDAYFNTDICKMANRLYVYRKHIDSIRTPSYDNISSFNNGFYVSLFSYSSPDMTPFDDNAEMYGYGIYYDEKTPYDGIELYVELEGSEVVTAKLRYVDYDEYMVPDTILAEYDVDPSFIHVRGNEIGLTSSGKTSFLNWIDSVCSSAHATQEYERAVAAQENLQRTRDEYDTLNQEYQDKYFPEEDDE